MEVKPDSKREFQAWSVVTVDDLKAAGGNALATGPFGSNIGSQFFERTGVPVIRGSNLANDGRTHLIEEDFVFLSERKAAEFRRSEVFKGDLIFTCWGTINQVGLISNWATYPRYIISNKQMKFTPNPRKVDSLFLFYRFSGSDIQSQISNQSIGTSVPGFNLGQLRALNFSIPSNKAEQESIAKALSDADALIKSLEQLLVKKRQLKRGAMQELLTGKKRLAGFHENWKAASFDTLFNFSSGLTASRGQLSSEGYCYLHYGDIHASRASFIDVRSEYHNIPKLDIPLKKINKTSLLADGDVVFVDASEDNEGTSKHVVIVNGSGIPFISGLHTIVAKSKTNALDHKYLRYCFQAPAIRAQFRFFSVGTKVSGISKTNIAKISIPVPSIPEQSAIAAILADMDAEITTLEAKLVKARQIKRGMMQELLTGRTRLV